MATVALSVADVLSHRFFLRRSEPDPDDVEAAQARLERVVSAARSGWTPSGLDDNPGAVAVDDGLAVRGRVLRAHARPRTDRRIFDGRALAALAVLAVLSLLIAAWYVWHSWPVAADVPARAESVSVGSTASPAPADDAAPPTFPAAGDAVASPTPTTVLVVHVAGSVAQPGIVTLPSGSRVADAIQAAGGALPGTDTTGVNLARVLVDGEQVLVGVPAAIGAPVAGPGAPVPTQGAAGGPLDLNAATLDQLQNLPGLGPVLAQRIVDWRTAHGRFTNVDELQEVSGIGEQRLEDLRPLVRV